jgi:hypothetical protein
VPSSRRRAIVRVAFACSVVGSVAAASAEELPVPVRVDYRGAEVCSDAGQFLRELLARDARVRTAGPGERAPLLVVTVTPGAHQTLRGRLVVEDVDGAVSRRDVDGDGCESVLGALALMAAIAVDPTAPLNGAEAAQATRPTPAPATPAPDAEVDAKDQARGSAGTETRGGPRLGLVAGAGATTGTAPSAAWTIPVSAEIAWGRDASISPLFRAGFEHADSGQDAATGGDARFVLNAGTLDLCASVPVGAAVRLLPCVHAEGGTLGATGSNIQPALTDTRPWAGLGALGAVRYLVLPPVFVELSLGVRFPLVRDRFFFEPDTTVFRSSVAAAFASGSLGITIL